MKLSEKILYSRKRAGLSQEALADMVGVSRQAVSSAGDGEARGTGHGPGRQPGLAALGR